MIRRAHTHPDGKECFVWTPGFAAIRVVQAPGTAAVLIGYRPSAREWFAYNEAGERLGTFSPEFYEEWFLPYVSGGPVVPDPECGVARA